ncbi:DUF2795 domain-containing protein [Actinomadura rubrisoli]|uniref:DUF2795 domain-containing protein n=1 Tax=Actinomadura rubrisoli TaxID=2530368 RepID=A0A4R5AL27_9ACTN|nr:DUF2795 domain-containing protein [Actinomadura rubrisoli]TDD72169.1 DUF2795 domain-containing protein [Actinomadura rubrisoli]
MRIVDTGQVEEVLSDLGFPASKQAIVEHAHRTRPGTRAERALAALPLGTYASAAEVLRSIPIEPDPERSPSERDYQRRHHDKPGLAEHMRDTERPPVEDELRRGDDGAL